MKSARAHTERTLGAEIKDDIERVGLLLKRMLQVIITPASPVWSALGGGLDPLPRAPPS